MEAWAGDSGSLASNILLEKEKKNWWDGGLGAWALLSDSEAHIWMKTSTLGIEIIFLENEAKWIRFYGIERRPLSPQALPDVLCMNQQTAGVIFKIVRFI